MDVGRRSFVVRIWCEPPGVSGSVRDWRGTAEDVQTGNRYSFQTLADLAMHLARDTGMQLGRLAEPRGTQLRLRQWTGPNNSGESGQRN